MLKKTINYLHKLYNNIGLSTADRDTFLYRIHLFFKRLYWLFEKNNNAQEIKCHGITLYSKIYPKSEDILRVLIAPGIGDALWTFVMIPALLKKYNKKKIVFIYHCDKSFYSGRSFDFLKRFSFVEDIVPVFFRLNNTPYIDSYGFASYKYELREATSKEKECFDVSLIINTYLEKGLSYEEIFKIMDLDFAMIEYNPFRYYLEKDEDHFGYNNIKKITNKPYLVVYFSAINQNAEGLNKKNLWTPLDWCELLKSLYDKLGYKMVIVGSSWDASYLREIEKNFDGNFHDVFIDVIGHHNMPETIQILKNAYFVIGFASGLTITSIYLGTKTAIFWRPEELCLNKEHPMFKKEFAINWVPPKLVKENIYTSFWYSKDTPKTIMEKLENIGWI